MRPIYKSLALASTALQVSLALNAETRDDESASTIALQAELLDSLRVELVAQNVSGARNLIESGECVINGSNLAIALDTGEWTRGAMYRVQVLATFGTQTQVIYALNVTVPYYEALSDTPQEYEDTVTVVSTISDGDKSGADATVYAKDGDGNAHITTPLSIGNAGEGASIQASGNGAIASGYANGDGTSIQGSSNGSIASGYAKGDGASIQANSNGSIASGLASGEGARILADDNGAIASGNAHGEGANIQASSNGSIASGYASGEGASILADDNGSIASGNADGGGASIQASGNGAIASGYANGDGTSIRAVNNGAIASGYADVTNGNVEASGQASQAFGLGVKAMQNAQMVVGKCNVVDEDGSYQFIVGNGADDGNRSNAFAVTKSGELALFESDGTPVILTAANLKALIASLQ